MAKQDETGIIRTIHDRGNQFAQISRRLLTDERLSWEARGVLCYLLSKPVDWEVRFTDLVRQGPGQADRMRRILRELEQQGYMVRHRTHGPGGRWVWITAVYENPADAASPYADFPYMVEPHTVKPDMVNRHIYTDDTGTNTDPTNKESTGTLNIAGTYDDSDLHRALSSMSDTATGDMRTDDIPRTSPVPCADPGEMTVKVKVDTFDSLPSARPDIVNGRPVRGAAPAVPVATKHPAFAETLAALLTAYPLRKGGTAQNATTARQELALIDPAEWPAILAAAPVYRRSQNVQEGVIIGLAKWLHDREWECYGPPARPASGGPRLVFSKQKEQ